MLSVGIWGRTILRELRSMLANGIHHANKLNSWVSNYWPDKSIAELAMSIE